VRRGPPSPAPRPSGEHARPAALRHLRVEGSVGRQAAPTQDGGGGDRAGVGRAGPVLVAPVGGTVRVRAGAIRSEVSFQSGVEQ
jgi:hypothetical protein